MPRVALLPQESAGILVDRVCSGHPQRYRQRMVCRDGSPTLSITLAVDDCVAVVAPKITDFATPPG